MEKQVENGFTFRYKQSKKMKKIECIILLIFWFITCNAQTFIQSDSDSTVVTEYNDGKQWAYRKIKDFVVGLTSYESKDDYGKYYQINIFIQNQSDTSVTFNPEDVDARLINKKGDTLQLKVYTNEAFQKKIKKNQAWTMALYGFSAGLNAGNAGYSTSYSTSYSPNGYAYTTITQHYDANAAYQANVAASNQIATLSKTLENDRAIKEEGYLKMTTIHPGESIVGYMNIKRKKGQTLTVDISVNGNIYSFHWDVRKKKK